MGCMFVQSNQSMDDTNCSYEESINNCENIPFGNKTIKFNQKRLSLGKQ